MLYTEKQLWCAKYLKDTGALVDCSVTPEMISQCEGFTTDYTLTRVNCDDFYTELAKGLRNLWPAGEKDGKYPWRDSEKNIANRLHVLWQLRKLDDYPIETCLTVARRYLAQFEHSNIKYMKTLKYFILRQNERIVESDGRIHYSSVSTFADMLESTSTLEQQDDYSDLFESTDTLNYGGEII